MCFRLCLEQTVASLVMLEIDELSSMLRLSVTFSTNLLVCYAYRIVWNASSVIL